MEENQTTQQPQSKNNALVPVAILALVLIVAVGYFVTQEKSTKQQSAQTQTIAEQQGASAQTESVESAETKKLVYKDGTYQVIGNYVSPGGPREIDVTVTLQNDIITDSTFVGKADDPMSKRFQGEFGDNYQSQVIGKNIDEIILTKVSGSSLTPKGFNDALSKIKVQAQQSES